MDRNMPRARRIRKLRRRIRALRQKNSRITSLKTQASKKPKIVTVSIDGFKGLLEAHDQARHKTT